VIELSFPWLSAAVAAPLLAALAALLPMPVRARRALATAACAAALGLGAAAAAELDRSGAARAVDPLDGAGRLLGQPVLAIDALNALLLPFAALIGLAVQLAAPRGWLTPSATRRSLLALAVMLASFACVSGPALAGLWALGAVPVWLELRGLTDGRRAARLFLLYMGVAVACMIAGVALAAGAAPELGAALLVAAVLARKGIAPLHSWMPEMFGRASLATSTLFSAPQVGAYVAVRLVLPQASDGLLLVMGSLALATAVYGAGLAMVQRDARRAYGCLFMSQSALVVVGLDGTSTAGLTGGLIWWLASGLALAGLGICLWLLETRRGSRTLTRLHGGHERMPVLAASFLILGLASVGFPGTVGYVGAELLVGGAVEHFPHIGFLVLIAAGLNAITVVRMYFTLFCGRRVPLPGHQRLRAHEYAAVMLVVAALFAGGLWPGPLVRSRARAAAAILDAR
jgi:NADH-quinone oxidoreductase subunit M